MPSNTSARLELVSVRGVIRVVKVYGYVRLHIEESDPQTGKPYLVISVGPENAPTEIAITTNVGEMIGGASKGARERWEQQN